MEIYLINGPEDIGKSSLILAQYYRLMSMKLFNIVEQENVTPFSLNDFRYLLKNQKTNECIYLNSPTDTKECINDFENFYLKNYRTYNITTIVSSIRDKNHNSILFKLTMDAINRMGMANIHTIDLSPLFNI